jgi:putative Flp pilus-assembly TadE/G-like protein
MTRLRARLRGESGQVLVFVAVILTGLVGMTALVVDVGSWYQAQRHLQTGADAAALAGAQELPVGDAECGDAEGCAIVYAQRNDVVIGPEDVTFPNTYTIDVVADADTPGIFAPVLNEAFDFVTVHAEAQATVRAPLEMKEVAPIAVYRDIENPSDEGPCVVTNPDCFGKTVTLTLVQDAEYDPTKSKFGLLDLDRAGSAGAGDMKKWLEDGYPDLLPIDTVYPPANGEKNGIKKQLEDAADAQRVLLFPVYDTATPAGYHVIGWAAFVIDEVVKWSGKDHELTGHYVTFISTDLAGGNTISDPDLDFGVHVITLTK